MQYRLTLLTNMMMSSLDSSIRSLGFLEPFGFPRRTKTSSFRAISLLREREINIYGMQFLLRAVDTLQTHSSQKITMMMGSSDSSIRSLARVP